MDNFVMRQSRTLGLSYAVNRLITARQSPDGPEIELCDDLVDSDLRHVVQVSVLFIARELLTNACRHSHSRRILVGIGQDDSHVYLQVQDWGVGFDSKALSPARRGLKGVYEVVQWLGGTLHLDSRVGGGTCVVVEIPILETTVPAPCGRREKRLTRERMRDGVQA